MAPVFIVNISLEVLSFMELTSTSLLDSWFSWFKVSKDISGGKVFDHFEMKQAKLCQNDHKQVEEDFVTNVV